MENSCPESDRAGSCTLVFHMPVLSLYHLAIKVTRSFDQHTQLIEHFWFHFNTEQKQVVKPQNSNVRELLSPSQLMFTDIFPDLADFGYRLP